MKSRKRDLFMETRDFLQSELTKIEAWEKEQSGLWFWERLGRLPFKLLDKITPKFVHQKIGLLLDELGSYLQNGGKYVTSEKAVLKAIAEKVEKPIEKIEDVEDLPLTIMTVVSTELKDRHSKLAAVQGATTGIGGFLTLAVDIPALLGLSLKTLQDIAIIHGYSPNEKEERIFIIKCLQFASADVVGKNAILKELSAYYNKESHSTEMMSQLQGWREVVYTYRDQMGWKKLFQMIPIAGIVFGAFTNRSMIQAIAEAGTMLYRKRRIMERLHSEERSID